MPYLLNLAYLLLLVVVSPWILYRAIRTGKYREGYSEKLLGRVPRRNGDRPCVWLHAVSVGEVNLLAPLLKQIATAHPEWECVVSTTTRTGMELARRKYAHLTVFYCPLDFTWAVRRAMRRIRPSVLVLAELELWPNLVWAARRQGARVAVVNGRLSQHSFDGYRRIRPLAGRLLRKVDLVAAQDETYARRFLELGAAPESVAVTGSMKFDGAQTDRNNEATQRLRRLAGIEQEDVVFLAGSTQEPEEAVALEVFAHLSEAWPQLRLVLVPRHPERFDAVARLLDQSGHPWQRRTELDRRAAGVIPAYGGTGVSPVLPHPATGETPVPLHSPRILLVDVVGELGAWWGTARIAFVGGSLGNRGGQNMIEPAAYGAAVSFGPNTRNFRDIVAMLLARDAAVVVEDAAALEAFVRGALEDAAPADAMGQRAKALVSEQLGATARTLAALEPLVERPAERSTPHSRPSSPASRGVHPRAPYASG